MMLAPSITAAQGPRHPSKGLAGACAWLWWQPGTPQPPAPLGWMLLAPPGCGAEARLPWSAPKPFAHPAPGPGAEPRSPDATRPPAPSCAQLLPAQPPDPPPWVGTRLAPARLSWRVLGLHPRSAVPQAPGDAKAVGAPCVGLSRGWGTLGACAGELWAPMGAGILSMGT